MEITYFRLSWTALSLKAPRPFNSARDFSDLEKNGISMRGFCCARPVCQAPCLKKWREFRRLFEQINLRTFFLVSNIFTSLMESWCIVFVGNQLWGGQNYLNEGSRTIYFHAVQYNLVPRARLGTKELLGAKTPFFLQTHFTYCINITKPQNI